MRIGITDSKGVPFSPERFEAEPGLAQEFLEIYDTWFYGPDVDWRELPEDMMFQNASYKLYCLEQDLAHADFLKSRGQLQ